jgi:hypothetical protein
MDVPFEWVNPRRVDLLDANESTWAFVTVDRVGDEGKSHVTALEELGG